MRRSTRRRGEPLLALVAILMLWVGVRVVLWEQPYVASVPGLLALRGLGGSPWRKVARPAPPAPAMPASPLLRPWQVEPLAPRPVDGDSSPMALRQRDALAPAPDAPRSMAAAAHQLMWMAAMAELPSPQALLGADAGPDAGPDAGGGALVLGSMRVSPAAERRWSGDGWLLWRRGGSTPHGSLPPPSYGASQGGMVLRYRLAPSSPFKPTLYLRATGAADGSGEADSAFGFSARPIEGLPVILAAEARVSRFSGGGTRLRPAVMMVTELAPQPMPFAMRAEMYAAAGYVGGYAATAFVDGQLRVDRPIATIGPTEIRAGGGAWGGAQQGANRLDVGPTASVKVSSGQIGARLGVDWRFRVVGDAAPSSGPAMTLAAGF